MNIGTLAYATNSGLGILARDFFAAGVVNRVLLVPHRHYTNYTDWYPDAFCKETADEFLTGLDCLLLFETGFYWDIVRAANAKNIPVALMPMYEFSPKDPPCKIDLNICPSLLDLQYYGETWHKPSIFIPVPVSSNVEWRQRSLAKIFVHNAGHGGYKFRNGTPEVLESLKHVKSDIKLIVRVQPDGELERLVQKFRETDSRLLIENRHVPYDELWSTGDVFLFPEQFNGLSLPMQEAFASGLLVMAANRFPMNTWLPVDPLIPVSGYKEERISVPVKRAVVSPEDVASTIDSWYDKDITVYSVAGREWAEAHSWERLKPRYMEALTNLRPATL